MRVSKEKAHENRERVINVAGALLREKGIDGIGIVDLMDAAGMTHGGFYRQFKSKDDLVAQAIARAFGETEAEVAQLLDSAHEDRLGALVKYYVSMAHVEGVSGGCSLAALASDAARSADPELRTVFADAIASYLDTIASVVPGVEGQAARKKALAILPAMVGAVVVARAITDKALQAEVIEAVRESLAGSSSEKAIG